MTLHCWEHKEEWDYDEWEGAWPKCRMFTCMLEKGHQGPCKWTPDEDISVTFKGGADASRQD